MVPPASVTGSATGQVSSPAINAVLSLGDLLGLGRGWEEEGKGWVSSRTSQSRRMRSGEEHGALPRDKDPPPPIRLNSLAPPSIPSPVAQVAFQQPCEVLGVGSVRKLRQALSKCREEGGRILTALIP